MNGLIAVLLFCCLVFVFGNNIDLDNIELDYFYSRTRNAASKCDSAEFKHNCSVKCGGSYTCAFERCFCFLHSKHSKFPETAKINPKTHDVIFVKDSYELPDSTEKMKKLVLRQDPKFLSPNERRHHIAHFCKNLGTARKCIRRCMKLGKPAFCGKDHVCYCGHKYDDFGKDPVVNPNNMYSEFQDLYAKYFGSTERNDIISLDDNNDRQSV